MASCRWHLSLTSVDNTLIHLQPSAPNVRLDFGFLDFWILGFETTVDGYDEMNPNTISMHSPVHRHRHIGVPIGDPLPVVQDADPRLGLPIPAEVGSLNGGLRYDRPGGARKRELDLCSHAVEGPTSPVAGQTEVQNADSRRFPPVSPQ